MDGLRKFIAVDNHEAVVGWLAPRHRVFPGGQCLQQVSHQKSSEKKRTRLHLRAHEEGVRRTFIGTTNRGDDR